MESMACCAPVAQLDRAPDYESGGQEFESLRARHSIQLKLLAFQASPINRIGIPDEWWPAC